MPDAVPYWLVLLPSVNAVLNATSAVCLATGYVAIRCKKVALHRAMMLSALTASAVFLAGYLTRMWMTGTHRFPAVGLWKTFYLTLLFSHMVLAIALLPLVLRTVQLALTQRFEVHRRWARITWPIWMYVSVTGVVVYAMLYHLAPRLVANASIAPL